MANLMTVRLNRGDSPNLGFRLQGGKDFGTPLVIQKVNGGSPAERAGLIAGDAVIKINNTDVFNLRHKDAQDVVVRAGPNFEVTIQRGGSTWKPSVVPTGSYSSPTPSINNISPVTRTSLAATKSENIGAIGTGHNLAAKPFNPQTQVNGSLNGGPKLINKQYNTPVKLYSEESIAETLSAQTEVLSTGALGVNFKKNEKNYDASNSAVLRMLKECENEPSTQEEEPDSGVATAPISAVAGLRHVTAPENRSAPANPSLPPGQNICADCERLIVGVFVRIKDKNLHVDCFKCSTCGTSLKNVGYYSINNKLYCDIHAKAAAIKNNPNPSLVPVTVPPSIKVPVHTISSALSSHPSSSPTQLSPRANNLGPTFQASNISGPKPFSSVNAPLSPVAPPAPSSNNSYSTPTYSPVSATACPLENVVWPPPHDLSELPTACPLFYPPPSQVEKQIHSKRSAELEIEAIIGTGQDDSRTMSRFDSPKPTGYSPGDRRSAMECREAISEYLETQRLVENIVSSAALPVEIEVPPPEAPAPPCLRDISEETQREICEHQHVAKLPNPNRRDNCVPLKWESPLTQAIRTTAPDADTFSQIPPRYSGSALATALAVAPSVPFTPTGTHCEEVPLPEETVPYFPPAGSGRNDREESTQPPETPQGDSLVVSGTPPQRRKKKKDPTDKYFEDLPKPQETLSLRTALTTAPERPYSPLIVESAGAIGVEATTNDKIDRSQFQRPTKPEVLPSSFQMNQKEPKPPSYYSPVELQRKIEETSSEECIQQSDTSTKTTIQKTQVEHEEQVAQNFPPMFQGFSCSFQNKTEHSQFSVEVMTTPPVMSPQPQQVIKKSATSENSIEELCELHHTTKKLEKKETQERAKQEEVIVTRKPVQPVHLHKPEHLPQYQVEISAEAEAELMRMQKMHKAQSRLELQKQQSQATQLIEQQQPVIKIESEVESRPACITPSLTNKPPPVIPYYQANLVPQHMSAPAVHLFDPKSPDISRSPSPCPGARDRSCSPGAQARSTLRAVSPATDPPAGQQPKQMYQMLMKTSSYARPMEQSRMETTVTEKSVEEHDESSRRLEQTVEGQRFESSEARKAQKFVSQSGETVTSTSVEEQSRRAHLEQSKKSQVESVERSKDGAKQVQRKKIVTEEFERHQKETNIQIEKTVTTTRRLPFHEVNAPSVERDSVKGHVTDPRPLSQSTSGRKHQQQVPNASSASTKRAFAPSSASLLDSSNKPDRPYVSPPDTGAVSGRQIGGVSVAPKRGRGVLNAASLAGARIPLCGSCNLQIRGPFITALGKIWCPNHFICVTPTCRRPLQDLGFVEEHGQLYCEYCFEQYLAPPCSKCSGKIRGDCLKAIGKNFHPECFNCTYCGKLFGNSPFFLEDGSPYCENDWNELFTTKCFACGFPVEAGDRWVEALNNNYHSQCFNCTMCKKNLEGQSFFAKGGRPFCKNHAR